MFRVVTLTASRNAILAAFAVSLCTIAACEGTLPTEGKSRFDLQRPRSVVNVGEYVKVYVHAHQDDWQLFMGDHVNAGLQTVPNVVFIYTSAGDANLGTTFWQYREIAAQMAMDALLGPGAWSCATQTINTHPLRRCVKGTATAYDMRLPDGAQSGEGFAGRGSLAMLRDGDQASLTAIDGSTTYTSWTDFYVTLRGIVDYESNNQGAPYVEVHAPEYDRTINTNDHPDHLATADAVRAAAAARSWNLAWYVGYQGQNLAINLTQADHDLKQTYFYAYDNYMGVGGYGRSQYEPEYQAWLWRTYVRTSVSIPTPPPAAPTNLQAVAYSSSRINLTWTDNATNETGYSVERAPDNAGTAGAYLQIASLPPNSTGYASTGLTSNTLYWFRVRAFSAADFSSYSNEANATTLQPPAAPSDLQGQALSTTRIDLSWVDNATNETGYVLERAPDNAGIPGAFAQIASLAAGSTTYSNTGLNANTSYWYRVRAVTATDFSAYSAVLQIITPQGPGAPTNLQAQAVSASQINLTWNDNATTETGYTVERAPDNNGSAGTFAAIASLAVNAANYSDASVSPATRYWYRVRAFTATDVSVYSASTSATTPQLPPAAPSNLQAQAMSSSSISLTWTDNANNESGFLIERAPDNAGSAGTFAQIASVSANVVTFTSSLLNANTLYWYRIRSFNSVQNSAYSNQANATTLTPPTSRTDVYVHAHQDDWELFMGDHTYTSVQVATKVVFVYATAGDAGHGASFWQSRELAAQAGVDALIGAGAWTCASQTINTHAIRRCAKGKAVSWDMRLPDGATSGEGFSGHGSMSQLRDGVRASLAALDASTTYTSWLDLTTTVRGIIDFESGNQSAPYVEVHGPDYIRANNPGDHADHLATADALQSAASTRSWNLTWYVDYQIQNMAINLTQAAHDIKRLSFYAYDNYMGAHGLGRNQYESEYQAWLWRTYFRTQTP